MIPRSQAQGRAGLAVEGAAGLPVRRYDGHDAGHPGEPSRLPAGLQPEAGPRLPDRAHRGGDLAGVRGGREPRVLPVRRQGTRRGQLAPPAVGRAPPRGRPPGGPLARQLGDHRVPRRARRRAGQPPEHGPPPGGLPPRATAGPRRPPRPLGQADVDPVAGPGGVPRAARVRSRSGRRGSASGSRASGPGRSWW